MGRTRTRDRHLPRRLYLVHGTYWFRPIGAKPVNFGRDYAEALRLYAGAVTENWAGRTVGDVIDRYRVEVLPQKRSAATRADQDAQLSRLKAVFGGMLPDGLTAKDCYRYMDGRRNKDGEHVPVAARHEISLLGHVLSKSIRWGVSTLNAVRGLDFGPRSPKRQQVTMEQVRAVQAMATPRMRLVIEFAILTGQRRADLLACRQADCSNDGILFRQGKTRAQVLIEWSDELRACVKAFNALSPQIPREYVIRRGDGRAYTGRGIAANWQRLMRKAAGKGVAAFTFHDLRSVSADGAATPEEARDRLGHADVATTKRHYLRGVTRAKPMR
jgi:integrase